MADGLSDLEREYLRARDALRESTDSVRSRSSSRDARAAHEAAQRRFHSISQQISPAGEARIRQIIPDELFDAGLGPEYDPIPSRRPAGSEAAARYGERGVPPGTRSKLLKGATAGVAGLGATALAKVAAAKSLGALGGPIEYALDPESRTPTQFLRSQEEFITGLPGLVSPSELPPPAVLPPDRLEAVEATQGMTGIAPSPETPNVTVQEVRAYVKNRVAKGKKLPKWAESITSMKNGRLVIKPMNPRKKARQEAAKRPHNPRMGTKRKHGGY